MKTLKIIFLILCTFLMNPSYSFVILIDPGHGGEELGAVSKIKIRNSKGKFYTQKIYEKNLSLRLSKKIKKYLDPKFTVYLTRSIDRKVSLEDRAAMADTVKADIFISVHFNSSHSRSSNGFETYYLDNHKDKAIEKVEHIENKDLMGDEKVINQILIDLVITKTVNTSKKLANFVHGQLAKTITKKYSMRNREIKPGLFYVLALSKRPGLLIEAGFMSNQKEVKKLNSSRYLDYYAKQVAIGIEKYYQELPKKDLPLF